MTDNRKKLPAGTVLEDGSAKIILREEVGRGASCIVYNAEQIDKTGINHNVRVKECYPVWLFLERDDRGNLTANFSDAEKFSAEKNRFLKAYEKNSVIRNTLGLVNSTVNAGNFLYKNQTCYSVMTFDEGSDYKNYTDASLKELLVHIKSLSLIIGKYHQSGYLHLDIKPENILILPETAEHILLFDFDSMISFADLKRGAAVTVSYSDGFSAPEQVQGKVGKIGTHTDIFSIGAVLFYKLFGRKVQFEDCTLSARYDFTKIKYPDSRYQPPLYKKLRQFFNKTLSLSIFSRWKNIEPLTEILDELILLADTERIFPCDNFHYNTANFIGRAEELSEIHETLKHNQLIFLSGLGGLGKTELAKKYAAQHREEYDTIIFCRYDTSIVDLVANEIIVNGLEQEEDESAENFFARKLSVMKKNLDARCLIIVDNLDTDADENLEELFSCPCKFIITTREDFSEYNYRQLTVEKIKDPTEILEVFRTYNDTRYDSEDFSATEKIIRLVDNHTMMVELIAKYLRETEESPARLYEKFLANEGITAVDDTRVKQRKDKRLRATDLNKHLRFLFNLSNFSEDEQEIMRSLSLMGGVRIRESYFVEMLSLENSSRVDGLIKRGWIEFNDATEKISLHQIILDLVYADLKPTTENCPHITAAMIQTLKKNFSSWEVEKVRDKFADIFMSRISGDDLAYAELCLNYGVEKFLEPAEKICRDREAWDTLQKLHRLKIKYALQINFEEFSDATNLHEYLSGKLIRAAELLDEAIQFCDRHSTNPNYSAKNYLEISLLVDEAIRGEIFFIADEEFAEEINLLYGKIFSLADSAAKNLSAATELTAEEKISLLEKIRDLHSASDFTALYRSENFSDPAKQIFYQEEINKLKPKNFSEGIVVDATGVSLSEAAFDCWFKGEFDKAIALYEKAYALDAEPYDYVLYALAETCREAGYTARAIEYLERILEIDREQERRGTPDFKFTCYACDDLINIFLEEGRRDEARKLSEELIRHNAGAKNFYEATWLIVGRYDLYRLETEPQIKKIFWENCTEKFRLLDGEEKFPNALNGFLKEYARKLPAEEKSLATLDALIKRAENWGAEELKRALFERAIKISEELSCAEYLVKFLTEYSLFLCDKPDAACKEAMTYCDRAEKFLAANEIRDEYLQSLIYFALAKCMRGTEDFSREEINRVKEKCNCILLTEKKIEHAAAAARSEAWEEAADFYESFDAHAERLYCLKKAAETIHDFEKIWRLNCGIIDCHISLNAAAEVNGAVLALYKNLLENFSAEENFAGKIKTLAGYLAKTDAAEEFFALNFFAVYAALVDAADTKLISSPTFTRAEEKNFFEAFRAAFENSSADKLDFVSDVFAEIKSSPKNFPAAERYVAALEEFLYRNQFNEIEFKN